MWTSMMPLSTASGGDTSSCGPVSRVRTANVTLGTRKDGEPSRLWMAVSEPPERRKRAQLAAKTKRLLLEMCGVLHLHCGFSFSISLLPSRLGHPGGGPLPPPLPLRPRPQCLSLPRPP